MKGINFITDENDRKTAVVIDLKTIEKYDDQMEDLIDIIIAESRKDEESIPFEAVVKELKRKRKL